MSDLQIRKADWHKDSDDVTATHFLAYEGDFAIGTARLLADGCIGRVSVLKDWRGLHVGEQLLMAAVKEAESKGLKQQTLTAQVHAAGFYERLGFTAISDEFLEAGIPHIEMLRNSQ